MVVGTRSRKKRSCLTNLPDDPLYLIFKKLDSNRDRNSFGLTCHRFLDIQSSSLEHLERQQILVLGNPYNIRAYMNSFIVDKLLSRFRQLESLSLTYFDSVTDSGLALLQNYGAKLRSLHLEFCSQITVAGISSIASGCPSLSVIYLSCCPVEDSGLEMLANSCKSLKEVSLVWFHKITDRGVQSLIHNCHQLRALRITGCRKVNGKGFKGCSSTLSCLEASSCKLFTCLTDVVSGGGLEYLNLGSVWQDSNMGHTLAVIGSGLAANLKILSIWGGYCVEDYAIKSISKGCPLLQEWDLTSCKKITISGWESIGLYCRRLERIHVSGCLMLCDRGLLALGSGCKPLSMIYMGACPLITPSGIQLFQIQSAHVEIKMEPCVKSILPSWAFKITSRRG